MKPVNVVESLSAQIGYWMEAAAQAHWEATLQMKLAETARLAGDTDQWNLCLSRARQEQNSHAAYHKQMWRVLTRLVNPRW